MGLPKSALTRNFGDLPPETNMEFLEKSMKVLQETLIRDCGNDLDKKIKTLEKLWCDFKNKKVNPRYRCVENAIAIRTCLAGLRVEKVAESMGGTAKVVL